MPGDGPRSGNEVGYATSSTIIHSVISLSHAVLNASHNSISLCEEVGHWARMLTVVSMVPDLYGLPNHWVCSFVSCMLLVATNA